MSTKNNTSASNDRIVSFYRDVFDRNTKFGHLFRSLIFSIGAFFQIIAAVFLRRNMGERYLTRGIVRFMIFFLLIIPKPFSSLLTKITALSTRGFTVKQYGFSNTDYFVWYGFVLLFAVFSYWRLKEITRSKSTFDMSKFSWYSGDIFPWMSTLGHATFRKTWNTRQIETLIEPLIILSIGFVLWVVGLKLGYLFIIIGLFYRWSYLIAYRNGDHHMLDIIDARILQRGLHRILTGADPEMDDKLNLRGRILVKAEEREIVYEAMFGSDKDGFVEAV
ncbi:MAG: hypothetical protein RL204_432 [Bacteroidota bacterium]|jgi:hypothetical protein